VQMPPQQGAMPEMQKPQVTNRTYTRRNESAGDRSGVPKTNIPQPAEPRT